MVLRLVRLIPFLLMAAACGGGSDGPTGPSASTPATVVLAPATTNLAVGGTTTLTPTVKNSGGTVLTDQALTWSSSAPAIATVAAGVVTAVTPGQATISAASSNGKVGNTTIHVLGPPASITVTRSGSWLLVGDTLQPGTIVKDAAGVALTGQSVTWSATGAAGTMAGSVLTTTAPGTVTLTATIGTITGTAQINVWPGGGTRDPLLSGIDSTVIAEMIRRGIPGGAVAISRQGRLVLSRAYGYADSATKRVAATDQLWRIGSVSKPITAVAAMKLVEGGAMNLTDKPFAVLTGIDLIAGQTQDARLADVTVKNLLEHSGGWNASRNVDDAVYLGMLTNANFDPKQLIRYGRGVALAANPGTAYAYSNYEYLLLGRMIERASGQSYENYVKTTILAPAGITAMKLGRSPLNLRDPKEVSYYPVNETITTFLGTGTRPNVGGGQEYSEASGQWLASALDMVKFVGAVDLNTTRPDVLSISTINTMMAQNFTIWPTAGFHYGLGWNVVPSGSSFEYSHAGGQDGGDAYAVRRADGVNAALLFNLTRGTASTSDAAFNAALGRVGTWPAGVLF